MFANVNVYSNLHTCSLLLIVINKMVFTFNKGNDNIQDELKLVHVNLHVWVGWVIFLQVMRVTGSK